MFRAFPLCSLCHTMLGACFSSVCLKLIWGKTTSFSRALFLSSFSIFADLRNISCCAGWFRAVVSVGFHCLMIYFCDEVNTQVFWSPYMSDKQSLQLVSTGSVALFPCRDHQQPPARAWRWVGIQARKEGSWPARCSLWPCVSPKCCWLATNVTVGETGLFVTTWLRSPNSTEFLLLGS